MSMVMHETQQEQHHVPADFVRQVDACLDQAVAEGWVASKSTAALIYVTVGCILANLDTSGTSEGNVHAVGRWISSALGI